MSIYLLVFWGECILTTYLINRISLFVLQWKSSFDILFNIVPPIDHLKITGYLCYVVILSLAKFNDKFSHRGIKCIVLGYLPNQEGYELFHLQTNHNFINRDVEFLEHIFPFKTSFF